MCYVISIERDCVSITADGNYGSRKCIRDMTEAAFALHDLEGGKVSLSGSVSCAEEITDCPWLLAVARWLQLSPWALEG